MRLRVLLPALGLLGLCACNVKPEGIAEWEVYRGEERPADESLWQPYVPRTSVPGDPENRFYWLRTRLPGGTAFDDPALYFYDVRNMLDVYLDDRILFRAGEAARPPGEELRYRVLTSWPVVRLPADSEKKILLIRAMEPGDQREGILGGVYLGEHSGLQRRFIASDLDMLVLGFLFILVALLSTTIGLLRKNSGMTFAFGLFALFTGGQTLAFSEILYFLIPDVIAYTRGFIVMFLMASLMLFVDRSLGRGPLYIIRLTWISTFLYGSFLALSGEIPGFWLNFTAIPLILFTMGFILWKAVHGEQEARIIMGGLISFALLGLNDILLSARILPDSIFLMQWGMFLLVLALGATLVLRFFANESRLREYARELEVLNRAYERFVPAEFLEQLGKENIVAVELGDQVEKSMTVLFSDIRSFTTLSEKMTPRETFAFINEFLERMGPVIRRHGGFIDKYIGDAIMALFPGSPDAALRAAGEMTRELEKLNAERRSRNQATIQIGVGIHIGRLMLGTIGEARRMEGTVISDSVNLASRLEGLTKKAGHTVIVSEAVRTGLAHPDAFALKFLGEARVKGKAEKVRVYGLE